MQEAQDKVRAVIEREKIARRRRELEQEQALANAQLDALHLKTAALAEEIKTLASDEQARLTTATRDQAEQDQGGGQTHAAGQAELARVRGVDSGKDRTKKGSNTHANQGK